MKRQISDSTLQLGRLVHERLEPVLPTFPIVAEKGSPQPFAVYRRQGIRLHDTKDRFSFEEIVSMEVIITASSYPQSVELAMKVKQALSGLRGTWEGLVISSISLVNADEEWVSDSYIQRLYFEIIIDNSLIN